MSKGKYIALDVETTGLNPRTSALHGVGLANDTQEQYYTVKEIQKETALQSKLAELLGNADTNIVGHNLRFDMHFISQGYQIKARWWDTKILAKLIDENRELGLKPLTESELGAERLEGKSGLDRAISKSGAGRIDKFVALDLAGNDKYKPGAFTKIIAEYCAEDCRNTHDLFTNLSRKLKDLDARCKQLGFARSPLNYYIEEAMPLEPILLRMEQRGVRVNVPRVHEVKRLLNAELEVLLQELNEMCQGHISRIEDALYEAARDKRKSERGKANVRRQSDKYKTRFNWASGQHIGWMLELMELPTALLERTPAGAIKTDASYMRHLQYQLDTTHPLQPVLDRFLRFRKVETQLKTFIGQEGKKGLLSKIEPGDRIYPHYHQVGRGKESSSGGPVTGRLSSSGPNFQNIPRSGPFRSFFVPDTADHIFWYADYDQVELRVAAHMSGDKAMCDMFMDPTRDPHQETADWVGITRQQAKVVNFLIIYGGSPWRLKGELGEDYAVEDCQEIIDAMYERWPGLRRWQEQMLHFGHKNLAIVCANGLVRRLPNLSLRGARSRDDRRAYRHAVNQLYNTPIQSYAATIAKMAMIKLAGAGADIVNQTHDSIVCQLMKQDIDRGRFYLRIMENAAKLRVPLTAEMKILNSFSEEDVYERPKTRQHSADAEANS